MSAALLPPVVLPASLETSVDSFLDAAEAFFSNLAAVEWGALALALALHFAQVLCRSRGWFNALRAAYPSERFRWRRVAGAYIAGVGVNSVMPARAGDVVKIYLAKQNVPNSRYPTVASSFFVESVFDATIGSLVLLFALTQGVLPTVPELPSLPAFDLSFWADHARFALFTITIVAIALLVLYAALSVRAVVFWRRIKQGVVIFGDFRRYLRQVAAWQLAGWLLRFSSFFFFLEAFNIGGSVENVLLVLSVQALSTLTPFTPGGAGAQQALLVFVFRDVAPKTAVLAYSVGQQLALAAFNAAAAAVAIFLLARTLSFRGVMRRSEQEKLEAEQADESTREAGDH